MTQAINQPALPDLTDPSATNALANEQRVDAKIVATLFGAVVLLAALISRLIFEPTQDISAPGGVVPPIQSQIFAAIASLALGAPIVIDAFRSLILGHKTGARNSNMQLLFAIAILAAFASSDFMTCGVVAFLLLISSFIEDRTAVGARRTIESLIRITPTKANRKAEDGSESEVAAKDLKPGDVIVVRPGENVAGDGIIRAGFSTLNEANITGESLPVEKREGEEVFSGTINETGRIEVEITRAGEDSTLGQVQQLILQAAASKPVVVRLLEQYASFYTPTVLMVAAIIYLLTEGDLARVISFILIACPVAIVVAGPTAVVAALSAAARLGVLIKGVANVEIARRITAIVFDKTGTLTVGQLSVTKMTPAEGVDAGELLKLACALERESNHPVAKAVVAITEKAKLTPYDVNEIEEVAGRGMKGVVNDQQVMVGREAWLQENGVDMTGVDASKAEGLSLLFVAQSGRCIGWLGLEDTIRSQSRQAMDELAELGVVRRVMITGDRWSPANRVAKDIHLTDVKAEALPGDKLKLVEELKREGHTVAVVGDGVNDGPALAAGDVSIAMGAAGSDVAIHSASIALMNNNLDRIPFLFELSQRTVRVMRQNLIGVGVYIFLMLGLLAIGTITPAFAALGQVITVLAVAFNSARLIREGEHLADPDYGPNQVMQKETSDNVGMSRVS